MISLGCSYNFNDKKNERKNVLEEKNDRKKNCRV